LDKTGSSDFCDFGVIENQKLISLTVSSDDPLAAISAEIKALELKHNSLAIEV